MKYVRMPIEVESPEALGYHSIECNLAESSVRDVQFKEINLDLNNLVIAYGDHTGKPELRQLIAGWYPHIQAEDVLLTVGAAAALFIIETSLLTTNDHIIVVKPNYATNIETPKAIGCAISFIDLHFEDDFALDIQQVTAALQPNTKLISITTPHNPTGTIISEATLLALNTIAEQHDCFLLVDETYRDLSFTKATPMAATLGKHAISVSSVSKAYGIPGVRLGWLITQNPVLQQLFLAAKEQIHICNSVVDEEICYQYLQQKETYFPALMQMAQNNFGELEKWMRQHDYLEWVKPSGGVVCFPRFKNEVRIDEALFYEILLDDYKTYVGPGHWFEQSKRSFRLGFGWEKEVAFLKGLHHIDLAIQRALLVG